MGDIDLNKVAAEVSYKAIQDVASSFENAVGKLAASFRLERAAAAYATAMSKHYSRVRTIIHREPVDLRSIYVHLFLSAANMLEERLLSRLPEKKRFVVTGSAGCGKTFLLRHLLLKFFEDTNGKIPVFLELRQLQPKTFTSIWAEVGRELRAFGWNIPDETVVELANKGKFALFLDGLDELPARLLKKFGQELTEIEKKGADNWMVVTSREGSHLFHIGNFAHYTVRPLVLEQAVQMVERVEFDAVVKRLYLTALRSGLFARSSDILRYPLFVYVMLLVFDQYADIPNKLVLFYRFAVETLFIRHDATKQGYQRETQTDLALDETERVLERFCLITYLKDRSYFSKSEVLSFLRKSIALAQVNCSPDALLFDLTEVGCILQRDGLEYTFTHRSWQEYFAASCLASGAVGKTQEAIGYIHSLKPGNQTISMVRALAPDLVEGAWLNENLGELIKAVDEGIADDPIRWIEFSRPQLVIDEGAWALAWSNPKMRNWFTVLEYFGEPGRFSDHLIQDIGHDRFVSMEQKFREGLSLPAEAKKLNEAHRRSFVAGDGRVRFDLSKDDLAWLKQHGLFALIREQAKKVSDLCRSVERGRIERSKSQELIDDIIGEVVKDVR